MAGAYDEGYDARIAKKDLHDNPYDEQIFGNGWIDWNDGWYEAKGAEDLICGLIVTVSGGE